MAILLVALMYWLMCLPQLFDDPSMQSNCNENIVLRFVSKK